MSRNSGYCLSYSIALNQAWDEFRNSAKYTRYWRKVERKFRLKRTFKRNNFSLSFKHAGLFAKIVYDDESIIEGIARHYGYDVVDEAILPAESIYKFALKES